MARVRITKGGKTGTVDEKELPAMLKDGWVRYVAPQSGEGEEPSPEDQDANVSRDRLETLYDAGNGFMRGATFGFDDMVSGGASAAVDLFQSTLDGRPRDPTAYQYGVDLRRQEVQQSRERSPTATPVGEFAGAVATSAVPVAKVLKAPVGKLAKMGRAAAAGAVGGAVGGVGEGDSDNLDDAADDAVDGAVTGAVLGGTLGTVALVPGAVVAAKTASKKGWRSLLTAGKQVDDLLLKDPVVSAAADKIPFMSKARKVTRFLAPTEEATTSLPPELPQTAIQGYLDRLLPKVADDVPARPDWLRETAADSLEDLPGAGKVSGRAVPLEETAEEIARRKAIQSFLYDD